MEGIELPNSLGSSGGARVTRGAKYQDRVAAWLATISLHGSQAPWVEDAATVMSVGGETGFYVDDVAALTSTDGILLLQAKGGLQLRRESTSELAKAVRQLVKQFLNGIVLAGRSRPLDPSRDRLCIVSDKRASQTVKALKMVSERLRSLPTLIQIEAAATTANELKAVEVLIEHVFREWAEASGNAPPEETLREFFRCVGIEILELDELESDLVAAKNMLRAVLLDPTLEDLAWTTLVGLGLSEKQLWYGRNDLASKLSSEGSAVGPAPVVATSVDSLRRRTTENQSLLETHAGLPTGSGQTKFPRPELDEIAGIEDGFLLVGDPGCGKSGLFYELSKLILDRNEDAVLLTIDSLGTSPSDTMNVLGISMRLEDILRGWTGEGQATLMLDGLDAARGASSVWLQHLVRSLTGTRWRVIASIRRFDLRYSVEWRTIFTGQPISSSAQCESEFSDVRHFVLGNFTDSELDQIAADSDTIAHILQEAGRTFRSLMANPFNLRLACELVEGGTDPISLAQTRDQLALLKRYWTYRIDSSPTRLQAHRLLTFMCEKMVRERSLRLDSIGIPLDLTEEAQRLLESGMLVELPQGALEAGPTPIVFSHHILFDYSVAILVLTTGPHSRLAQRLQADAGLVFVARPSIDLHLAFRWHMSEDRHNFGTVVKDLLEADAPLAGIAAARIVVQEVSTTSDLDWLLSEAGLIIWPEPFATLIGWLSAAMHAGDERIKAHVRESVATWAFLARNITERLSGDFQAQVAGQLKRMLFSLGSAQDCFDGGGAASMDLAWAVRALMDLAVERPNEREWLATQVAQLLPWAVKAVPSYSSSLGESLAHARSGVWGTEVLRHYVDAIGTISAANAELATRVLETVWGLEVADNETTYITQGVLTLTSNRKQDLDHVKYMTGQHFGLYLAHADLRHAVSVASSASRDARCEDLGGGRLNLTTPTAVGSLNSHASPLRFSEGHGAAETIVERFVRSLEYPDLPDDELSVLVDEMVRKISNPLVWQAILRAGRDSDPLGRSLIPALASGALLVNGQTAASACRLVSRWSETASETLHAELEAAVRSAISLIESTGLGSTAGRSVRLLNCLDRSRLSDPHLAAIAAANPSSSALVEDQEDDADEFLSPEPTTLIDYLGQDSFESQTPSSLEVLEQLRQAPHRVDESRDGELILEVLRTALANEELSMALYSRDESVEELVLGAVAAIATKFPPAPDEEVGDLIVSLLLEFSAPAS